MPRGSSQMDMLERIYGSLGTLQTDVKQVGDKVSALSIRVEGLETRSKGDFDRLKSEFERLEREVKDVAKDFTTFKDEQAKLAVAEAKEAGEERGTNKTNWKTMALIGGAVLALLGDVALHFVTGAAKGEDGRAPTMRVEDQAPRLQLGPLGGSR